MKTLKNDKQLKNTSEGGRQLAILTIYLICFEKVNNFLKTLILRKPYIF
jgi:hypothetical protein